MANLIAKVLEEQLIVLQGQCEIAKNAVEVFEAGFDARAEDAFNKATVFHNLKNAGAHPDVVRAAEVAKVAAFKHILDTEKMQDVQEHLRVKLWNAMAIIRADIPKYQALAATFVIDVDM